MADLKSAERFLERLLKRTADRHGFADRFHLNCQFRIGVGEFFEGPARDLGDDIIDRRFEAGECFSRNIVLDFVQPVSHSQLRRDFCNWETSCLGRERTRSTHSGIHFDDHHPTVFRIDGKLDIGTTRFNADFSHHGDRRVAHPLVFFVGKRLGRSDRNRVARVNAHGVKVFDRTDNDDVICVIAHDLHLVLFPTNDAFIEQHFVDGREFQTFANLFFEFIAVVSDAAANSTQREAGSDNHWQADFFESQTSLVHVVNDSAVTDIQPDFDHGLLEGIAFFGLLDHVNFGTQHFDAKLFEYPVFDEVHRRVQASLTTKRRQQCIRPLHFDDLRNVFPGDRLNIRAISHFGVGHDRGWVRIDQHDFVPLFAKGFAGLGSGIVKLAGLPNHNGTRTDNQNLTNVVATGHGGGP